MSILVDRNTQVVCQGMTGRAGTHYSSVMLEYGTRIVACVRPGKHQDAAKRPIAPLWPLLDTLYPIPTDHEAYAAAR